MYLEKKIKLIHAFAYSKLTLNPRHIYISQVCRNHTQYFARCVVSKWEFFNIFLSPTFLSFLLGIRFVFLVPSVFHFCSLPSLFSPREVVMGTSVPGYFMTLWKKGKKLIKIFERNCKRAMHAYIFYEKSDWWPCGVHGWNWLLEKKVWNASGCNGRSSKYWHLCHARWVQWCISKSGDQVAYFLNLQGDLKKRKNASKNIVNSATYVGIDDWGCWWWWRWLYKIFLLLHTRKNISIKLIPMFVGVIHWWWYEQDDDEIARNVIYHARTDEWFLIMCVFIAGRPPPRVVWYRNGKLIDTSDYFEDGVMKNDLMISILARSDLGAELTCEASNNNISRPLATTVQLDMNCKFELSFSCSKFLNEKVCDSNITCLEKFLFFLKNVQVGYKW